MTGYLVSFALALSAAVAASSPSAAADVAKGEQLTRQWCVHCHVIAAAPAAGTVQQGPPSLRAVAQGGRSGGQLRAFLSRPHGAMPDLALARSEIDDLIAYIETLR
jgi:mono/diheme cytochrome c family protein